MSNRFHSKFHRQNHHTYPNYVNPDAGHDPIASPKQPFQGDFVLAGALSCVAPLSAAAGYFYSNNTALCAIAGDRGAYVYSRTGIGVQINSVQSTALSAYGAKCGSNLYSPLTGMIVYGGIQSINAKTPYYGIYSYGGFYGGSYYSPVIGLSAFGGNTGFNVYSPLYGIISYGGTYGGNFTSKDTAVLASGQTLGVNAFSALTALKAVGNEVAIVASSPKVGISVYSPLVALSSGGGGVNRFDNRIGIFKTPQTQFALDVKGNTYVDGNITVTGDVSAYGSLSYFETNVYASSALNVTTTGGTSAAATFIQYGVQPILVCYDGDTSLQIPSFIVKDTYVGIGTATPNKMLTVNGTISSSNDIIASTLTISGNMSASGDLTLGGNLSASGLTISGNMSASGNVTGGNLAISNWDNVYSKVNSTSADWNRAYAYISTVPILTSFLISNVDLQTGAPTYTNVFTIPSGRRFIAKLFGGLLTTSIPNIGPLTYPVLKLVSGVSDNIIANDYAPSDTTQNRTDIVGNVGKTFGAANEAVKLKLTTVGSSYTTLLADIIVEGYLI
jgi:hypothetical protein